MQSQVDTMNRHRRIVSMLAYVTDANVNGTNRRAAHFYVIRSACTVAEWTEMGRVPWPAYFLCSAAQSRLTP